MSNIDPDKLAHYRKLADRDLWDLKDKKADTYFRRARSEGVNLVNPDPVGTGMFLAPRHRNLTGLDLALVGIPLDLGVPNPRPGTRMGPNALRQWSLNKETMNFSTGVMPYEICNVADWGEIEFRRAPYNLDACIDEIFEAYQAFAEADVVPLTIGGEHTCTFPILKALGAKEPLGLIHLDAHADTCVNFDGVRVSDATVIQLAVTEGVVDPERTIQIGLRGRGLIRSHFNEESGMRVVLAEEFQERGAKEIIAEARKVVGNGPCYLTIDSDVIDASEMPGTTLPEPFGLYGREVRDFIRGLRGLNIIGADFMELSPAYDPTAASVSLAAGIAFEQFCLLAESRAEHKGVVRKTHWKA